QRSLAGAFSKIDCGFRNPSLLLGLAIWFSKTEPLVSTATSCYLAAAFCFFPASAGRLFYSIFASPSTTQFRFSSLLLPEVLSAAQWLPLSLSGGRLLPPPHPGSTYLVGSVFFPASAPVSDCDHRFGQGARLLSPPRPRSTTFVDRLLPPSVRRQVPGHQGVEQGSSYYLVTSRPSNTG
ncbi:hypothetical protein, partial [Myxococcus eversor]|uniref:hypothetical protein n=1 Tax=Myxococcus eversor TaxID=2709661 RepID=UPI0019673635